MSDARADSVHRQILSLTKDRKYEEALRICYQCVETWEVPFRHHAWHNLGYVLWNSGRKVEAIEAVSRAIDLAPDDRSHRFARARWCLERGDLEHSESDWAALIRLEEALSSVVFLGTALLGRALTNVQRRKFALALADLERVDDDETIVIGARLWTALALREQISKRRGAE